MGVALARSAQERGAKVFLVAGKLAVDTPAGVELYHAETAEKMHATCQKLTRELKPDVFLGVAAVGDWTPAHPSAVKVPTSLGKWVLELVPTRKIIDEVKNWSPETFLCAFRAQVGLDDAQMAENAQERLVQARADLIAANDTARPGVGFESPTNAFLVWGPQGKVAELALETKELLAEKLLDIIRERL